VCRNGKMSILVVFLSIMFVAVNVRAEVIQLPKTNQKKCYATGGAAISCAGTGQDGETRAGVAWPGTRFKNNGDNTQTDRLTGLIWPTVVDPEISGVCDSVVTNWAEALARVACLNAHSFLGYQDWRLPNVNEYESLRNGAETEVAGWLNSQGFFFAVEEPFLTSTSNAANTYYKWTVLLAGGNAVTLLSESQGFPSPVWPVRGGQSGTPSSAYPANVWKTGQTASYAAGDDGALEKGVKWPVPRFKATAFTGGVRDDLTGLIWTRNANAPGPAACGSGTAKTWQGALNYVKCLNANKFLGFSDWRLPNRVELHSLTDFSRRNPALPAVHPFINVKNAKYWSSTSNVDLPGQAVVVHMGNGRILYNSKNASQLQRVWPVRSGIVIDTPPLKLSATAISSSVITLSWNDGTTLESGYRVETKDGSCSSGSAWTPIATTGPNVVQYTRSGLVADSTHSYRVRAYNAHGYSAYSNCAFATTGPSGAPASPSDLKAYSRGPNKIDVYWKDNSSNETNFFLYRRDCLSCPWDTRATLMPGAESFSDGTATGNEAFAVYSYYLIACNGAACSPATRVAAVPLKPTGLTANPVDFVNLKWTDNSSNETGFQVYRKEALCADAASWVLKTTTAPNVHVYLDNSVISGTFAYHVRAFHESDGEPCAYGYSNWSNCAEAIK